MARYIPIGEPVNESEAELLRALRDSLPDHFVVLGNFDLNLPGRRNTLEFDAVVVGEYGLYAVEIKGWRGEVRGDLQRWHLAWGRVTNPLILTERKAKALRGFVGSRIQTLPREVFCQAVLLVPDDADLRVAPELMPRILKPSALWDFFVDRGRIEAQGPGPLRDGLQDAVVDTLIPLLTPGTGPQSVGPYDLMDELEADQTYRLFIGRHRIINHRPKVRIKRYQLDPLSTPNERKRELTLVSRDVEALDRLGSNPYIAAAYDVIEDREDDLIFYVVTEWVGPRTLANLLEEDEFVPHSVPALKMAAHLVRAVSFMHGKGIVHRNLNPSVIHLTEDESFPLKITDFDQARVTTLESIGSSFEQLGTAGYMAPELGIADTHDHRVDIFSVGAIIYELLCGCRLCESFEELVNFDDTWKRKRADIADPGCADILDRLLQSDPDGRVDDLAEVIEMIDARLDEAAA